MRASIIAVLVLPLVLPFAGGCGGGVEPGGPCPPEGGCFCYGDKADMDACAAVGANFEPFCCTDRGGALVQCGQPSACVPKPGLGAPGAMNANYCCPR